MRLRRAQVTKQDAKRAFWLRRTPQTHAATPALMPAILRFGPSRPGAGRAWVWKLLANPMHIPAPFGFTPMVPRFDMRTSRVFKPPFPRHEAGRGRRSA